MKSAKMIALAWANAGFGLLAMVVGIWLSVQGGGFIVVNDHSLAPLLFAEALKLSAGGSAIAVAVFGKGPRILGIAGGLLLISAGCIGALAIFHASPAWAIWVTLLALAGTAISGLWAALVSKIYLTARSTVAKVLALMWVMSAAAGLLFPPVALLAGVSSIAWWVLFAATQ